MKTKLISLSSIVVVFLVVGLVLKKHHSNPQLTDTQIENLDRSVDAFFTHKRQQAMQKNALEKKTQAPATPPMAPTQENLDEFIQLDLSENWRKLENNSPMASGKLQLNNNGKSYDVSVLRLPSNVPLNTVLGIWKQRIGLASDYQEIYQNIENNAGQQWQVSKLLGNTQKILIAFNKGETRYTFFRLSSSDEISESVEKEFFQLIQQSKLIKS